MKDQQNKQLEPVQVPGENLGPLHLSWEQMSEDTPWPLGRRRRQGLTTDFAGLQISSRTKSRSPRLLCSGILFFQRLELGSWRIKMMYCKRAWRQRLCAPARSVQNSKVWAEP